MRVNRFIFEICSQNILGASLLWHHKEQALFWTDIKQKRLYKCAMTTEVASLLEHDIEFSKKQDYLEQILQIFDLPHRLCSFAFTEDSDTILAVFESGVALYRYTTGELTWLGQKVEENSALRFSTSKVAPNGHFWLGTMHESKDDKAKAEDKHAGLFVCTDINANTGIEEQVSDFDGISSLCFSKEGKLLYHSDLPTNKLYQYTVDEDAHLDEKRLFAKFDKHCLPYGACVDRQDNVWVAVFGGAYVVCFNVKGKELLRLPLPVTQATSVAIGGPSDNWLFVSSASEGLTEDKLSHQKRAGNVFVYELNEALARQETRIKVDSLEFIKGSTCDATS